MVNSSEELSARLVRPKDAAISCSHFWANALIVAGLACIVVGAIIFSGELGACSCAASGLYLVACEALAFAPALVRERPAGAPSILFTSLRWYFPGGYNHTDTIDVLQFYVCLVVSLPVHVVCWAFV